jgi:hypothetical protein
MTDPFAFTATTPRLKLPNLFAAQAQREFTVNEAFARLDALLHLVVEGEANSPPVSPVDGTCWLVGSAPTGDWAGQAGTIAARQAGSWLFAEPVEGMTAHDHAAGQLARFDGGWQRAAAVAAPSGGSTADAEARTAIVGLIAALVAGGILPGT